MAKRLKRSGGIVYSTNPDFRIQEEKEESPVSSRQDLRVWKEFHGGKPVTVVRNFEGPASALEALGRELKTRCGVGGTTKNGEILIQGDQRDKVVRILQEKGYAVKKAGG